MLLSGKGGPRTWDFSIKFLCLLTYLLWFLRKKKVVIFIYQHFYLFLDNGIMGFRNYVFLYMCMCVIWINFDFSFYFWLHILRLFFSPFQFSKIVHRKTCWISLVLFLWCIMVSVDVEKLREFLNEQFSKNWNVFSAIIFRPAVHFLWLDVRKRDKEFLSTPTTGWLIEFTILAHPNNFKVFAY